MSCTAKQIVERAKSWEGVKEGSKTHKEIVAVYNSHKPRARGYKLKTSDPWCAGYASACAIEVGAADICPIEVGCDKMISLAKKMGIWKEDESITPKKGDFWFYDWDDNGKGDNKGSSEHVGICISVDTKKKTFKVIEGNYDNKVKVRTLKFNAKYLRGCSRPKYKKESEDLTAVAKDVIKGKYGNGVKRKKALEEAGYNFSEVQKIVNLIYEDEKK